MQIHEGFFTKFKKILSKGPGAKKQFLDICRDNHQLVLNDEEVTVKDSIAWIRANPMLKNKLFIIKAALLKELQEQNSPIRDIRF